MGGYGRRRLAAGIHDELWARAVAVRQGPCAVVWVSLDLIGLGAADVHAIHELAFGDGPEDVHLFVTCTGNHAGPDTLGLWSQTILGSRPNERYLAFCRAEAAQVARLALKGVEPVEMRVARAEVSIADAGGPGELTALQFCREDGSALATLVNYDLIPQVLDGVNTEISADFCHWLYLDLERVRDSVALYACAGERLGRLSAKDRSWEGAERVGRALAQAARTALGEGEALQPTRIGAWERSFALPPAGRRRGRPVAGRVGIVELGPLRAAMLPCLVSPALATEIRRSLDAPYRVVSCLSDGSLGMFHAPLEDGNGGHAGTVLLDEVANLVLDIRRRG